MAVKTEPLIEARVEQESDWVAWRAPARPHRAMGKLSMTVPVVIAGLAGLILLVAGEWMLIAVVAAILFAFYTWSVVPAEEVEYRLTSRGVRIGGNLYEWGLFTRWWMGEKWGHKLVFMEMPGNITGRLVLALGQTDQGRIEKVMEKVLLHEQPAETRMDRAAKWLVEKFPLEQKI